MGRDPQRATSPPRILAAEDASAAWRRVVRGLRQLGYAVDLEQTTRCVGRLATGAYGLLLLALLTPAAWDLLDNVADLPERPRVLAFRDADDADSRPDGHETGADHVLTLPCSLTETLVHLPRLLDESGRHDSDVLQAGDLEIDLAYRQVRRQGRGVRLTPREFDLLVLLAGHAGRNLARGWLIERLWGDGDVYINTLDVHIHRLRDKLERPFGGRLIRTVRGAGYRFEPTDAG